MADPTTSYEQPLSPSDLEDDRPIAVRRKRRSTTFGGEAHEPSTMNRVLPCQGLTTPPATPQRKKKRVRFSDPGPALAATGLTPFIRRASLGSRTPSSSRRRSTSSTTRHLRFDDTPISTPLHFPSLRQVIDGRVKRHLRRNHLSEELNTIESENRQDKREQHRVEDLVRRLKEKDAEIAQLRDEQDVASQIGSEAGLPVMISQDSRIQELEAQITGLKAELQSREEPHYDSNWTMAARDPYDDDETIDEPIDGIMPHFGEDDFSGFSDEMADIIMSTPCRRAFPSPPTTAPNTPCKSYSLVDASIQTSIPDVEKQQLEEKLSTLQDEVKSMTAELELNSTTLERLTAKLSSVADGADSLDAALDTVITELVLSQASSTENANRFEALSSEIAILGFSLSPEKTIELLRDQFRQARIELERLNPGESTEGFENAKLLDMLVSRLHVLTETVKNQDSDIDQYHEQEISLRKQLGSRVDAMATVQRALVEAEAEIITLTRDAEEQDQNATKLSRALDGYREEVSGLESLITRLESEHASIEQALTKKINEGVTQVLDQGLEYNVLQATSEGQEYLISDLSGKLEAASAAAEAAALDIEAKNAAILEHGSALALRDARVSELREELERVNASLKEAHASIQALKSEKRGLMGQVEGEKKRGKIVIEAMRDQLSTVLSTGNGYLNGQFSVRCSSSTPQVEDGNVQEIEGGAVVRPGGFLNANPPRRLSKKRRRYDSGLGFLEEEADEDVEM